jgi:peptidoglycan/xylan/chitin deacetylase (PgdA/CDA1 family)
VNGGLTEIRVGSVAGVENAAWAQGLTFSVPGELAVRLGADARHMVTVGATCADVGAEVVDIVRMRAAFTPSPPTSTRLPFSYQIVPLPVRTAVGHVLGRLQRSRASAWAAFPRWPLDLSADFVADICGGAPSPFADGPTPVLLSHDIDTEEGLRNLIARFLPIEELVGARSSNYVVPCAWPIDHRLLAAVAERGHELGIHGYDHANRTPFADGPERRRRIDAARPLVEQYDIIGYRAPSLLRTRELLDDLVGLYRYDSSVPTSGGLFPVPNNGCASARPFQIGSLIELPLTMPRDGSLMFLGHDREEIFTVWKQCAEQVAASGGIVSVLTHCEDRFSGGKAMLGVYRRFLEYLAADSRYAFTMPAQVLARLGHRI